MKDDIYEYLKLDHKKVAKLFDLYESSPSAKNKLEIVNLLNQELTAHAISEEQTFYKFLEKNVDSKKEAFHAEKEHAQIKEKLTEIINLQIGSSLDIKVSELKSIVEHHVSEEEGKIFDEAKKIITKEQAYILKIKMHDLKRKIILEEFA